MMDSAGSQVRIEVSGLSLTERLRALLARVMVASAAVFVGTALIVDWNVTTLSSYLDFLLSPYFVLTVIALVILLRPVLFGSSATQMSDRDIT